MWVGLFHGTIPIVAQTADLGPIDGSVRFRCARPATIGRYDLLDRFRLDVEVMETRQGPARHVVHPKKINLACGERRARRMLFTRRSDGELGVADFCLIAFPSG